MTREQLADLEKLMEVDLSDTEIEEIQTRLCAYDQSVGPSYYSNVRFLATIERDVARLIGSLTRERRLLRELVAESGMSDFPATTPGGEEKTSDGT